MSCSFKTVGCIVDWEKLWDCFKISGETSLGPNIPEHCLSASSPVADILVFAQGQTICVLVADWSLNDEDQKFKFHISWTRNICQNSMETITSILVLPVVSSSQGKKKKSSSIGPEWTCIAVGFSSGFIRFYNEVGDVLLSHKIHAEPVMRLKCQSFSSPRHSSQPEQSEELTAFFTTVVCLFPGFPLFSTLKAARNHLLRVHSEPGDSSSHPDTQLTFHKWRFSDQHQVVDCTVVGPAPTNVYHHLLTATLCGGFYSSYKSTAPHSTQVIATGTKPFVGFHYAMESSSHQILTDVAKVFANKLKSAIGQAVPSWFGLGAPRSALPPDEQSAMEPPEDMGCRFGLCDGWREGSEVLLSPLRTTCVVSDALGRLTLVDTSSGVAVRQWKGYRDAELAWIKVDEDTSRSKSLKRTALFLVVYAPKRQLVEVWAMQQGPCIASFALDKPGRLLYTAHGVVGVSGACEARGHAPVLFLGDDGVLLELEVPFHCILTEKADSTARDLHLLKKLRCVLRDLVNNEAKLLDEVNDVASKLRTLAVIREALGHLLSASHLTSVVLSAFVTRVKEGLTLAASSETSDECVESDEQKQERRRMILSLENLHNVTQFYDYISNIHDVPPHYTCVVSAGDETELVDLSKKLSISKKELARVSNLITSPLANKPTSSRKSVKFSSNFIEYIQLFKVLEPPPDAETLRENANDKPDKFDDGKVHINPAVSRDALNSVSIVMFQGVVYGSCSLTEFTERCKASSIGAEDLLRLAVSYWSNKEHGSNIYKEMIQFSNVLKYVCILKECCDDVWWQSIRSQLSECSNALSAMTGALICRGVALQWERKLNQSENDSGDEIDWDTYDESSCQWSLLIGQLEDISILDRSIGNVIVLNENALPYDHTHVTLEYVLKQGRGCVTELVARWLCACGFNPDYVVDRGDAEFTWRDKAGSPNQKNHLTGVAEGVKPVIEESVEAQPLSANEAKVNDTLKCLKQHFPYSLSCSSILAHMCWEYIQAYDRSPHRLEILHLAIQTLEQIQSSHIKQGMCYLIWTQNLRTRFESCIRLIHRVGKLPKELLCKQDLHLSDTQLASFLQMSVHFVEQYIRSNIQSETSERPRIQYELLWEGNHRQAPTFIQLSLTQPPASYELLHLLLQVSHAFHTMVFFSLKLPKPLNAFFDSTSQSALFTDIHVKSVSVRLHPDAKLIDSRRKFLMRALTSAIGLVFTDVNPDGEPVYDVSRCASWVTKIMELGAEWGVPGDVLRRHQVCELYASGYDQVAQEITPLVSDGSTLGSQLLVILGLRMNLFLQNTKNTQLKNTLSCLSPSIISWLDTLKSAEETEIETTSLHMIADFSRTILNLLPEGHVDRHMASMLVECLPQLVHNDTVR